MTNAFNPHFELLLAHGADPNISDLEGISPLHVGAMSANTKFLQHLYDADTPMKPSLKGQWPTHMACLSDISNENLRLLLQWGCDPNLVDVGEYTSLSCCMSHDAYRNVEVLL